MSAAHRKFLVSRSPTKMKEKRKIYRPANLSQENRSRMQRQPPPHENNQDQPTHMVPSSTACFAQKGPRQSTASFFPHPSLASTRSHPAPAEPHQTHPSSKALSYLGLRPCPIITKVIISLPPTSSHVLISARLQKHCLRRFHPRRRAPQRACCTTSQQTAAASSARASVRRRTSRWAPPR